jgi:hypothetical protein
MDTCLIKDYCSNDFELTDLHQQDTSFQHGLQEAIGSLNPFHTFHNFDLNLSSEELELFAQLRVEVSDSRYGNQADLGNLKDEIITFINDLSPSNHNISSKISDTIYRIADNIMKATGHALSIAVKANTAKNDDVLEWHTDPCFDQYVNPLIETPCKDGQHVIFITLKGQPTLLYPFSAQEQVEYYLKKSAIINSPEFSSVHIDPMVERLINIETNKVLDMSRVVSAEPGHAVVASLGKKIGALHAVPLIDKERLFIAIVLASESLIKQKGRFL